MCPFKFKSNEIIILLGAGASVDAKIPHSAEMIRRVEKLISENSNWHEFTQLYNYIRSSIHHSYGIRGKFGEDVNYNIEILVNTLDEIRKKQEHPLYPFVGAWNPTLVEVAGTDFKLVGNLRNEIVKTLRREWITLEDYSSAGYFQGLKNFQKEYEHPLRVFTLNYDLCVEKACSGITIEKGFNLETRKWDWRQFDEDENDSREIFLYKLHGSNDWTYDKNGNLTFSDDTSRIEDNDTAIIFGTTYKFQYRDPFLFLAYEFRRWALEARIIISIGYGFGDDHINGIIQQALNNDDQRLLLSVSPLSSDSDEEKAKEKRQKEIADVIQHRNANQIICCKSGARDFMENRLKLDYLESLFPSSENELFPIVQDNNES